MILIIKIGGNIIDNCEALDAFLKKFAAIKGHKILIHGGGKIASQIAETLDIPQKMIHGRRITDEPTLDVITMVYTGLINKNIVADLYALQCPALGVCGADAGLILAEKRPVSDINYGFVGDVVEVKANVLQDWLTQGLTPVIAPVSHDGKGQLLNTNADTIASEVAIALSAYHDVRLIYCFEKKGVLMDVNDDHSVIPNLNEKTIKELKIDGLIHSGMIPKLDNAVRTIHGGVESVIIGNADDLDLLAKGHSGTKISEV
ncbi:MAG: acetylglutamate kinase [Saprospiraceae bacterium]|nr:acetylglutamate kinase [Saprospiraceae bacterium]